MSQSRAAGAPLLTVDALTVSLPGGMDRGFAVEAITFELAAGETLCIVGESGSGKSITANAIMGRLPDALEIKAGRIVLRGEDLLAASPAELRDMRGRIVSIVFQDPLSALNPLMTIGDQIAEVIDAHRGHETIDKKARVVELLEEVGLPDPEIIKTQYPFRLSGGQRQRVMIAMALALEPAVLIADEPTTALDVTTQAQILDLIRTIQTRKDMGVMFITHDFGVVAEIADRVIVMERGRIVEEGRAADVLGAPRHPYTQRLIAAVPRMSEAHAAAASEAPIVLAASGLKVRLPSAFLCPRPRPRGDPGGRAAVHNFAGPVCDPRRWPLARRDTEGHGVGREGGLRHGGIHRGRLAEARPHVQDHARLRRRHTAFVGGDAAPRSAAQHHDA